MPPNTQQDIAASQTVLRDDAYWARMDALADKAHYGARELLRNFPAHVMRRDLPRFLSHYELFKHVIELPGCIIDLGVFRGASFFTWSNLLEVFCPFDRTRKVYGFDHFEGLIHFTEADGVLDPKTGKTQGGYKFSAEDMRELVALHNSDNVMSGNVRCELVEGPLQETLPRFIESHPGLAVSLLHFDMDLYEPTKVALEHLYPRVVAGGVVVCDEYGVQPWEGETKAIDEYLDTLKDRPVVRKHPFTQQPGGYFIK